MEEEVRWFNYRQRTSSLLVIQWSFERTAMAGTGLGGRTAAAGTRVGGRTAAAGNGFGGRREDGRRGRDGIWRPKDRGPRGWTAGGGSSCAPPPSPALGHSVPWTGRRGTLPPVEEPSLCRLRPRRKSAAPVDGGLPLPPCAALRAPLAGVFEGLQNRLLTHKRCFF
jgi:hypothetical protein